MPIELVRGKYNIFPYSQESFNDSHTSIDFPYRARFTNRLIDFNINVFPFINAFTFTDVGEMARWIDQYLLITNSHGNETVREPSLQEPF